MCTAVRVRRFRCGLRPITKMAPWWRAQTGVESPAYQPGPYSPFTEGLVEKIVEWYIGRLGEGLAQDAS